jgi:hypothetical protein
MLLYLAALPPPNPTAPRTLRETGWPGGTGRSHRNADNSTVSESSAAPQSSRNALTTATCRPAHVEVIDRLVAQSLETAAASDIEPISNIFVSVRSHAFSRVDSRFKVDTPPECVACSEWPPC